MPMPELHTAPALSRLFGIFTVLIKLVSVHWMYTYTVTLNCNLAWFQMIFIGWDEMRDGIPVMRNGAPVSGDPCFHRVCWALINTVSWVWPLGTRVFGRWSRHWQLANILSDPVQIRYTLTSWLKARSRCKYQDAWGIKREHVIEL